MSDAVEQYREAVARLAGSGEATEHSYRGALQQLLEALAPGLRAVNEPRRIACGAPDLVVGRGAVPVGYVETKDIGRPLDAAERTPQFERYRAALGNLILTDYQEFRWYVNGAPRLRVEAQAGNAGLTALLRAFLSERAGMVRSADELARRLAALAGLAREAIAGALEHEPGAGAVSLREQMEGFRRVLLHDLSAAQFADMYAQTVCYGLFTARCLGARRPFRRETAAYDLPKTNPFLREMFAHVAGPGLDDRVAWVVDDMAELLERTDTAAILGDFGRGTGKEDPVFHFYETFLALYDPRLRESRGVYYTPQPVVSYIVRSVDALLREHFGMTAGLADASAPPRGGPHRLTILDPAAGTGTFLHAVIELIHAGFEGGAGLWPAYVSAHLLPRVLGFELLMAPYAVAHMKLGLQLAQLGYDFKSEERLRLYLTNSLEEAHAMTELPLFAQWLAEEARAASDIKRDLPVMVVLGNPPYSGHSANQGEWIARLLRGYDTMSQAPTESYFEVDGAPLRERNPKWLNDDYVKFIRFAQWRIDRTGHGILAFISNNGYLENPTFRGMRRSLMRSFDRAYILNLHGNSKKRERAPDGTRDQNVFDIQQGVAIGIFVKSPRGALGRGQPRAKPRAKLEYRYADLWGPREDGEGGGKYGWLSAHAVGTTQWARLSPAAESYLFVPHDGKLDKEYARGWSLADAMPAKSLGIATARDRFTVHCTAEEVWRAVTRFLSLEPEAARAEFGLGPDARDWQVKLAQADVRRSGPSRERIVPIQYRPLDRRYTYYTGESRGFHCMPRAEIMHRMLGGENLALASTRSVEIAEGFEHAWASADIIQLHTVSQKEVNYLFPLWLTNGDDRADANGQFTLLENGESRTANFSPGFVRAVETATRLRLVAAETAGRRGAFAAEELLGYIYAVLHCGAYRRRFADFLIRDFARVPMPAGAAVFRKLAKLGLRLARLHAGVETAAVRVDFPVPGSNRIERAEFEAEEKGRGRVWINATQHFPAVSASAWAYRVGGYKPCQRWLADRKERTLEYEELRQYAELCGALAETTDYLLPAIEAAWAAQADGGGA